MSLHTPRRIFVRRKRQPGISLTIFVLLALGMLGAALFEARPLPGDGRGRSTDAAQPLAGLGVIAAAPPHVAVVDGETLRLGDAVIHLDGVTAPTREQPVGAQAAATLASLVHDRAVQCRLTGAETAGRPAGTCRAGNVQLNVALVRSGWARTDGQTPLLIHAEQTARRNHLGLWSASH